MELFKQITNLDTLLNNTDVETAALKEYSILLNQFKKLNLVYTNKFKISHDRYNNQHLYSRRLKKQLSKV